MNNITIVIMKQKFETTYLLSFLVDPMIDPMDIVSVQVIQTSMNLH